MLGWSWSNPSHFCICVHLVDRNHPLLDTQGTCWWLVWWTVHQAVILTLISLDPYKDPGFLTKCSLRQLLTGLPASNVSDDRSFLEFANYYRVSNKAVGLAHLGSGLHGGLTHGGACNKSRSLWTSCPCLALWGASIQTVLVFSVLGLVTRPKSDFS